MILAFEDLLGFWRSNAGIAWIAFSDFDFSGVPGIHSFMRRVTSSTYLFPAAPLGSINKFFFQCTIFHLLLSPFRKYFLPPNSSKTFLDFQSYLEYHCRCYCCCYWYYHCCHRLLLLLFGCCYWSCFFFGRSLNFVVSHDLYGKFLRRCYSLHFLQCSHFWFANLLAMQIYFGFHPWHEVINSKCLFCVCS